MFREANSLSIGGLSGQFTYHDNKYQQWRAKHERQHWPCNIRYQGFEEKPKLDSLIPPFTHDKHSRVMSLNSLEHGHGTL